MEVLNDLVAALKARLPGIHLRTIEEARALEACVRPRRRCRDSWCRACFGAGRPRRVCGN